MRKLKVGLVGSSQLSFPGDKEGVFARTSEGVKRLSREWDFDLYIYGQKVISSEDGYKAVKMLEEESVDFVLLQCTSFSAGSLAPIFARIKNAFLGLWAIPEFASQGVVPFNSLCGINMYASIIGHYLKAYQVPVKWYFGDVEDELFLNRFGITVRALRAVKNMKQSSIALIGGIAPGFDDLYDDERKLLKRFDGMRVNRLHEYDEIRKLAKCMEADRVKSRMEEETAMANGFRDPIAQEKMEINARYALAYEAFARERGYDALAVSCWPKFQDDSMYSICAVVGELNDRGIVTSCEGDLVSAVSMLFLKYIADDITMLMDMSAVDIRDDTVLFWHCGPASRRFCEKSGFTYSLNYTGTAHAPEEKEISGTGTVRDMVFDPGEITIARLTVECDKLFVATAEFLDSEKPSFYGSRGWAGSLTLNRQSVSARDFLNTVLVQRFQHHYPIVKGDYSREVLEAGAWLGLRTTEKVPYEDYMQNPSV